MLTLILDQKQDRFDLTHPVAPWETLQKEAGQIKARLVFITIYNTPFFFGMFHKLSKILNSLSTL